jgi:CPA1 family monovalent cation:H+ antiporter
MIIYLAFCLIVATLIIQGLTLPWLIRIMGLSDSAHSTREEQEARRVLATEAIIHLHRARSKNRDTSAIFQELIDQYQHRLDAIPLEREHTATGRNLAERNEAVLVALQAERDALIRLRNEDEIDDEVLRTLQRELDLAESRMHTGSITFH